MIISKTIYRYSFEGSSEPTTTSFPLHPRMNPKMANVQHRDTRMLVNLPYITDNKKMTAHSVRVGCANTWKQRSPLAFLGKDSWEQSSTKRVIHPAQEKCRAVWKLSAKINRKIRGVTPVKQKIQTLVTMHKKMGLSLMENGQIWLTYKLKWLWTQSGGQIGNEWGGWEDDAGEEPHNSEG